MRFKMMALVVAASVPVPVLAQAAPAASPTAKPDKKVCRRLEVTGSIIGSKAVCHTKSEWADIDEANNRAAGDSLQRQRQTQTDLNRGS